MIEAASIYQIHKPGVYKWIEYWRNKCEEVLRIITNYNVFVLFETCYTGIHVQVLLDHLRVW